MTAGAQISQNHLTKWVPVFAVPKGQVSFGQMRRKRRKQEEEEEPA